MKILSKNNVKYVINSLLIIAGTFLMGFAFNVFLNNNKISPSGFSGLCAIISNVLADKFNVFIPASIFYLCINAILFLFAFKTLGLKFAINSLIGILSYSVFMEVCNFDIGLLGTDLLLCALYGGVIMGIGMGLVFRAHGSTGGSDMLANLLNKKFRLVTTGRFLFAVNFVVVVCSYLAYNDLNLALYSLIAIWVLTKVADIVVAGVQSLRAYYIISSRSEEIAAKIMVEIQRGVTGFKSQGMYTHNEQNVLMTVVSREEVAKLRKLVSEIDKNAVMFSTAINEAMGSNLIIDDKKVESFLNKNKKEQESTNTKKNAKKTTNNN